MTDPCHQPDSQIDKALGADWAKKRAESCPEILPRKTGQEPEILFFGCRGEPGHHIHCKRSIVRMRDNPWGNKLDCGLLPETQREGICVRVVKGGWTYVGFWDRSGDSRGNSNSAFLVREEMATEEVLRLAREQWPDVFARRGFPVLSLP